MRSAELSVLCEVGGTTSAVDTLIPVIFNGILIGALWAALRCRLFQARKILQAAFTKGIHVHKRNSCWMEEKTLSSDRWNLVLSNGLQVWKSIDGSLNKI